MLTLDMILHLIKSGYSVSFRNENQTFYPNILRVDLQKDDKHYMTLIDISSVSVKYEGGGSIDDLISRYLRRAEWEYEYEFEKEKNKC